MEKLIDYVYNLIPRSMDFVIALVEAILILVIGLKLVNKVINSIKQRLLKRDMEAGLITFLASATKVCLYVLIIIVAAQILGFATSSVVALVGSAGLAIGLALQGSLANFAGGVLILLMKPFVVGDYIVVGDIEGTVKKIDVVYTTLLTANNCSIILPNGKLADSNIINNTKEGKRRLDIHVGIEYSQDIQQARTVLLHVIEMQEHRLDDMPTDVVVSSFEDSHITMMAQLWVHPDFYLATRFSMLENIKNEFEKNHITIPFQQLDVMLHTES